MEPAVALGIVNAGLKRRVDLSAFPDHHDHVPHAAELNALSSPCDPALLWRLQAYGHTVPDGLWKATAAYAEPIFAQPGFPFADVHMALLAAATGDKKAVEQRAAVLTDLVEAGSLAAGPVVPAICRAALAFAEDDYAGCARILEPVAAEVVRIGGSGGQRELVEDTLLVALVRSRQTVKARALLDRRLHRRPSARDTRWLGRLTA